MAGVIKSNVVSIERCGECPVYHPETNECDAGTVPNVPHCREVKVELEKEVKPVSV